jgi:hypothetical protein
MHQQVAGGTQFGVVTTAAGQERRKFRRSVGRLDTAFLMLAAIMAADTLGGVSSYGAQAFTWLIIMIAFFLGPVRAAYSRARQCLPDGGRPVRMGEAGIRRGRCWPVTYSAGGQPCRQPPESRRIHH